MDKKNNDESSIDTRGHLLNATRDNQGFRQKKKTLLTPGRTTVTTVTIVI